MAASGTPRRRALKIRSGDRVQVISGKDRGKSGRVLRVETSKQRLYVEGLNMSKRHVRPKESRSNSVTGQNTAAQLGGVIDVEGPIHVSNVMLLDAKGAPTRVGIERSGGERVRIARKTGARLE
ncbi:MAG TPA: 50S ribosomal protein L24 [Solirubrobacteraceae bacterium]|nr:50S ribosomal protein L24 [Solirubrobacteraceae bacterium]